MPIAVLFLQLSRPVKTEKTFLWPRLTLLIILTKVFSLKNVRMQIKVSVFNNLKRDFHHGIDFIE